MMSSKRGQEVERGERVIPETTDIEGADTMAAAAGNTDSRECLCMLGLPGTVALIESKGTITEQERPRVNRRMVRTGAAMQGRTGAMLCQRILGVGLSHSSEEACEGGISRAGGAKGRAGQGTRRRER